MPEVASSAAVPATTLPGAAPRLPRLRGKVASFKQFLPFAGPGYLVAVGYMDPGNWATALSGGSAFGYSLLTVIVIANVMAMCLQAAAARLGMASGMDLAQKCRERLSPAMRVVFWLGCEVAIVACNLAEVLGMALGLQLLLHIPLPWGVCMTAADVMLVLQLQRRGVRQLEAFIIALVLLIGACLAAQIWWLRPPVAAVAAGLLPTAAIITQPSMLYLAVGIIGATVMPHNLYLHSALVCSRRSGQDEGAIRSEIRFATLDSNIALAFAAFVNAALLVLAAGAFHRPGQTPISDLGQAYQLLSPLLGVNAAGAVFGLGLIASGLSSSITGTLAGQIIMEGFLDVRVSAPKRALITRALAIVPAGAVAICCGGRGVGSLLVLSQVILGLQLPFAVLPLLCFTTRRRHLGSYAFGAAGGTVLWIIAAAVVGVNGWLLWQYL